MAFPSSADMDTMPSSPRSAPPRDASQGMPAQLPAATSLHQSAALLPQESQSLLTQETPGMLPRTEAGQNVYPLPYLGMSGLGSSGFPSQPYTLPQLGSLFPPNPAHPTPGPGTWQ